MFLFFQLDVPSANGPVEKSSVEKFEIDHFHLLNCLERTTVSFILVFFFIYIV